jgi:hypothetical protein
MSQEEESAALPLRYPATAVNIRIASRLIRRQCEPEKTDSAGDKSDHDRETHPSLRRQSSGKDVHCCQQAGHWLKGASSL